MGSRWAATALAVVGMICALSCAVEGLEGDAELIHGFYLLIVTEGVAKGGQCSVAGHGDGSIGAIEHMSWWAGKDPKGIEERVRQKAGESGAVEQEMSEELGICQKYVKKADKCILKDKLVCSKREDGICVECTPELDAEYRDCEYVVIIANATEVAAPPTPTEKAAGAGGAWMEVPVGRTLLAGLVAVVFSFPNVS